MVAIRPNPLSSKKPLKQRLDDIDTNTLNEGYKAGQLSLIKRFKAWLRDAHPINYILYYPIRETINRYLTTQEKKIKGK
jgi:hypothetical protein